MILEMQKTKLPHIKKAVLKTLFLFKNLYNGSLILPQYWKEALETAQEPIKPAAAPPLLLSSSARSILDLKAQTFAAMKPTKTELSINYYLGMKAVQEAKKFYVGHYCSEIGSLLSTTFH